MTAGIVIHYLGGEQDLRKMGGLRHVLPKTWLAFLVGALSLAGLPPLSGFWTKDPIIAAALDGDSYTIVLGVLALLGTLLTGLYTFRMYFLVWYGERSETVRHAVEHPHHEDGIVRRSLGWPVAVLAVLSVVGGLLAIPNVWEPFATWIDEVAESVIVPSAALDWETSAIAVTIAVIGIAVAWAIYKAHRFAAPSVPAVRAVLEHKFYFDELYDAVFYRPAAQLAARLRTDVEEPVVEGSLDEIGRAGQEAGSAVARAQTGLLRTYAIAVAASAVVLAVVFVAVR